MGLFHRQQDFREEAKSSQVVQLVDLPFQIAQEYDIQIKEGEKTKAFWHLKGANSAYGLWEYQGDWELLEAVLEWREGVTKKGCLELFPLYKTKKGSNYVRGKQKGYFLTEWSAGAPFFPQNKSDFLKVIKALSNLHIYSKNTVSTKATALQDKVEFVWLKKQQERLTELLFFYHSLSERRLVNDFERLYVESFPGFYRRGQEAIQKMALARCDIGPSCSEGFLVGNFLSDNLLETEKGLVFLKTNYSPKGLFVQDLVLFLKMYLPLQKWDEQLAQDLLACYQERVGLNDKHKQVFLAQFSFPGRYFFYAEQYLNKAEEMYILSDKLKNYLYEVYWYDGCCEALERRLWGE